MVHIQVSPFDLLEYRICVCSLLPILYKTKLATGDFETVVEMYDELCKDSVPMIRKAAISVIPEFIKVMDVLHHWKDDVQKESCKLILVRSLYILVRDEQDSIRICGNSSCVALAAVLSEEDRIALILPLFLELAADNSWRVRFTTVTQIGDICSLFPKEIIESRLLPEYLRLMQDPELEVRTGAAGAISKICQYLEPSTIVDRVISIMDELSIDPSEHVRIALAGDFLSRDDEINQCQIYARFWEKSQQNDYYCQFILVSWWIQTHESV